MATAKKVEAALRSRNIRHLVNAIEDNSDTPGEVILWPTGKTVYSIAEAVEYVTAIAADHDATP